MGDVDVDVEIWMGDGDFSEDIDNKAGETFCIKILCLAVCFPQKRQRMSLPMKIRGKPTAVNPPKTSGARVACNLCIEHRLHRKNCLLGAVYEQKEESHPLPCGQQAMV